MVYSVQRDSVIKMALGEMHYRLLSGLLSVILIISFAQAGPSRVPDYFFITQSWNSSKLPENLESFFVMKPYTTNETHSGLYIYFNVPFFGDPSVPDTVPIGTVDRLWTYEVFEVFLLADTGNYLEIELGPKGHYLLLELNKNREVVRYGIPLQSYQTLVDASDPAGGRWHGGTYIPCSIMPAGKIVKFNAYTIHKSDPERIYTATYPTPAGKYDAPDFHRVEYFRDIDLSRMCP